MAPVLFPILRRVSKGFGISFVASVRIAVSRPVFTELVFIICGGKDLSTLYHALISHRQRTSSFTAASTETVALTRGNVMKKTTKLSVEDCAVGPTLDEEEAAWGAKPLRTLSWPPCKYRKYTAPILHGSSRLRPAAT